MDLSRLEVLIGEKNVNKLRKQKVLIIGLGGVGGYTFESLVRSGIENFILIDFDIISPTNINRQILTTTENIGKYKVLEAKKRALLINPEVQIESQIKKLTVEDIDEYKDMKIDFIVDACDDLKVKEEWIRFSDKYQIPLISCMGTGNKMHPEKLEIMELSKTSYDPIAKKLRKMVKDEHIRSKIMVVCSKEEKRILKYTEIPSNSFVPGVAGLLCASYVINQIVGDQNEEN